MARFVSLRRPGGGEISGRGYARAELAPGSAEACFPEARGPWGAVARWGLHDSVDGVEVLSHGALRVPRIIGERDTVVLRNPAWAEAEDQPTDHDARRSAPQ